VAIDYRLKLASAPAGLAVKILDGDRDLSVSVQHGTTLLVRGVVREPMLRIGPAGVFVNAASPTAQSDKLVTAAGSGWKRLSSSSSYTWHEHRLAPAGQSGQFAIPVELDGRASVIAGTFVRVQRPALWPWLGLGAALAVATAFVARHRAFRLPLAVVLAVAGGTAAFVGTVTFALRDRPAGGIAWLPVGAAIAVALALGVPLLRLHGRRRGQAAGLAGAVSAAVMIGALPVFWHGEVISALPGNVARLACALALVGGACAAGVSLLPEFDG
jgi:hypothetical protein